MCVCGLITITSVLYIVAFNAILMSPIYVFVFIRAAERILMRIQKEYRGPQQELLDLQKAAKHALSNHHTRLQELKDLVNEASTNTNETKHLLLLLNNNIIQFSVRRLALYVMWLHLWENIFK